MDAMPSPTDPKSSGRISWTWFLYSRSGQIRIGWKLLAFGVLLNAIGFSLDFAIRHLGNGTFASLPLKILDVIVVLIPTWLFMRLEKRPFSEIGLYLNARWLRDLVLGFLLACALMAIASTGVGFVQGGWVRGPLGPGVLFSGLSSWLGVAIFEELAFRGYPFQRMAESWGVKPTQGLMAVVFVMPHLWVGLLRGYPSPSMVGASLNIGCAALFLGFAFLWTRSLAFPIGIHGGWNWMQGTVLGLKVSGTTTSSFLYPARPGPKVSWITGGLYGPEASIIGTIAVLVGIAIIWHCLKRKPSV